MIYTLDTNALTALLTGRGNIGERFLGALSRRDEVTLNAVSYYEMKRGLFLPRFARRLTQFEAFVKDYRSLPMDVASLDVAVDIYQKLRTTGTLLEDADVFAAGIAVANNAVLVTRNIKHFARVEGLKLEDWEHVLAPPLTRG